jgi:hypothetical protein
MKHVLLLLPSGSDMFSWTVDAFESFVFFEIQYVQGYDPMRPPTRVILRSDHNQAPHSSECDARKAQRQS